VDSVKDMFLYFVQCLMHFIGTCNGKAFFCEEQDRRNNTRKRKRMREYLDQLFVASNVVMEADVSVQRNTIC